MIVLTDELMEMPKEIPKPRMTEAEFKRKIDFHEGDIVQIIHGKQVGRLAVIIGIRALVSKKGRDYISYQLKLSDNESLTLGAHDLKFIRGCKQNDLSEI